MMRARNVNATSEQVLCRSRVSVDNANKSTITVYTCDVHGVEQNFYNWRQGVS
jgi:hypothetical protein